MDFLQLQASAKFCLALLIFSIGNVENFCIRKRKPLIGLRIWINLHKRLGMTNFKICLFCREGINICLQTLFFVIKLMSKKLITTKEPVAWLANRFLVDTSITVLKQLTSLNQYCGCYSITKFRTFKSWEAFIYTTLFVYPIHFLTFALLYLKLN